MKPAIHDLLTKSFYNITEATDQIDEWKRQQYPNIKIVGESVAPYRMKTKNGKFKYTTKQVTTIYYKEKQ